MIYNNSVVSADKNTPEGQSVLLRRLFGQVSRAGFDLTNAGIYTGRAGCNFDVLTADEAEQLCKLSRRLDELSREVKEASNVLSVISDRVAKSQSEEGV